MRRAWIIVAGVAIFMGAGSTSGAASPLAPLGPILDRQEASPVELVGKKKGKRKKFRRIQRFGGRYYMVERRRNGRIRVVELYPLRAAPHRHGRALANREALERALRAPGRTVRRDPGPRIWEVPGPAEPLDAEPQVAARPEQPLAIPMPKPEPPQPEFEDFEVTPDEPELEPDVAARPDAEALAREAPEDEVGDEASISCEAAADIVSGFGFSEVEAKSCSGEAYEFAAKRDGMAYSVKINPADGELAEVQKQ